MVSACLEAYRATADPWWHEQARRAFDWFLGRNDLGLGAVRPSTGGCRDGLHVDRVNENQGAESTLAFLLSLAEMRIMQNAVTAFNEPAPSRRTTRCRPSPSRAATSSFTRIARGCCSGRSIPRASSARPSICRRGHGPLRERGPSAAAGRWRPSSATGTSRSGSSCVRRFEQVRPSPAQRSKLSDERQAAARRLFHPRVLAGSGRPVQPFHRPAPRPVGPAAPGSLRFILSLRATGEGHISSITFRTGYLDERGAITVDAPTRSPRAGARLPTRPTKRRSSRGSCRSSAWRATSPARSSRRLEDDVHAGGPAAKHRRHCGRAASTPATRRARSAARKIAGAGPIQLRGALRARHDACPSASSFPSRPPRATASKTPASCGSATTTGRSPTTPPTPPTTAS